MSVFIKNGPRPDDTAVNDDGHEKLENSGEDPSAVAQEASQPEPLEPSIVEVDPLTALV